MSDEVEGELQPGPLVSAFDPLRTFGSSLVGPSLSRISHSN